MNAGTVWHISSDVRNLFVDKGILLANGEFDSTKLDSLQEGLELVPDVEAVLAKYGITLPDEVDDILSVLPLAIRIFGKRR